MSHIQPWFPAAKLGIFVHYGVFSTMFAEDETHDWPTRAMPADEYRRRAELFTCEQLDMAEWARLFRRWGARYGVLTSRHAAGFALWDTQAHDRSTVRMAPCRRDLVAEWCDALRGADLKVGLYFCHRDWGDPDFCADMEPDPAHRPADPAQRDTAWQRYLARRDQCVRELTENYGPIDLFWADEDWGRTHQQLRCEQMVDLILARQPHIVLNNRFCHPYLGHYGTPEQYVPLTPRGGPTEICDTLAESRHWQYLDCPRRYKRKQDVLRFFLDAISVGCNYLVNIGPAPDGHIPPEEIEILDHLGQFIHAHAEAIYDTDAGLARTCFAGPSTTKPGAVYLFAVDRPAGELCVRGLVSEVRRVTELATGRELPFRQSGGRPSHNRPGYLWIDVPPDDKPQPVVYKLEYEGDKLKAVQA